MTAPTVSIVINNFNYERYVGEAIESALAQTAPADEVVVVDDGSTDLSRHVIEAFGRDVVPVFKDNGGQASCFNAGFTASRGDIVVFLDADDRLLPNAVEELQRLFAPGVVQAHWPLWIIDGQGERTGGLKPDRLLPEGDLRIPLAQSGPRSITNAPTSGNAWLRRYLEQVMPIPESEYRICADAYLYTVAPVFGELRRSLVPLACWRFHGENNYNGSRVPLQQRMRTETERYNRLAALLSDTLGAQRIGTSPALWRERNGSYRRMDRVLTATAEIERVAPEGSVVVLVDDGDWSDVFWAGDEVVSGRKVVRLFGGEAPLGPETVSDDDVIAEIERLRASGASHIAFVWPGTWWLRHYARLAAWLDQRYRRAGGLGSMMAIFDLTVDRGAALDGRAAELAQEIDGVSKDIARIEREIERREVVQAVRRLAVRAVPAGARVAVVSRGDEALVQLHEREGWHFPQTPGGVYAGYYPASDDDALAQLEHVRAKGAEYLVFPSTSFWWLDHYLGFRLYLESCCRKVAESADCIIFDVRAA